MHNILNIGYQNHADIIAIQEPFIGQDKNSGEYYTIAHPSYNSLIPQGECRLRVVIFTRKASKVIFTPRTNIIMDTDIQVIEVQIPRGNIKPFLIVNIYNEKSLNEGDNRYTIERRLNSISISSEFILLGDLNAHHPWWNKEATPTRVDTLIPWLDKHNMELINKLDIETFYRSNLTQKSVIDLANTTRKLIEVEWRIIEEATGSDHEAIQFSIAYKTPPSIPIGEQRYNLKKVDWNKLNSTIKEIINATPLYKTILELQRE